MSNWKWKFEARHSTFARVRNGNMVYRQIGLVVILVVKDDAQEGAVDFQAAVVFDVA
jgi:hypothetical protein